MSKCATCDKLRKDVERATNVWVSEMQKCDVAEKTSERRLESILSLSAELVKRTDELIAERDRVLELQAQVLEAKCMKSG